MDAELQQRIERRYGRAPCGRVTIRSFDEGVIRTMHAQRIVTDKTAGFGANFFLVGIPGLTQPPDYPGIPVTFFIPDDFFDRYRIPAVVVNRPSIDPALNRWHPGELQYRSPSPGASPVSLVNPLNAEVTQGYTSYVAVPQAMPFDIGYSITIKARNRGQGATGARNQVNDLFTYMASIWQPTTGAVYVQDSEGDVRSYSVQTTYDMEDDVVETTERFIGFTFQLRVEGELDLEPEREFRAVTQWPEIRETVFS